MTDVVVLCDARMSAGPLAAFRLQYRRFTSNFLMQKPPVSKAPTTITLGLVLGWAFGVVFALAALTHLLSLDLLPALIMAMLSALLLPPVDRLMQREMNAHFSGGIKIVLVLVGLTTAGILADGVPTTSGPKGFSASEKAEPLLELQSFRVYQEYGFSHIEGEVKNISDKPLENVMAVGSFYDAQTNLVKSADALIDYNPVLPGQISPFKVLTTHNPAITQGKIAFKFLLGGSIATLTRR